MDERNRSPIADEQGALVFAGSLVELVALGLHRASLDALVGGANGARGVAPPPIDRGYVERLLEEEISRQFGHPLRPVVEIVLNAVDAARGGAVDVATDDGSVEVRDAGAGMDLRAVVSRLLLPFVSDKSPRVHVGRFGVGFFSALGFDPGTADRSRATDAEGSAPLLLVATGDGASGTSLVVRRTSAGAAGLAVELRRAAPRRGTQVRVAARALDAAEVAAYLRETLHFLSPERATVRLDGVPINDGSLVSGGRFYEDEIEPGAIARFHLGGRGVEPGIAAATFHAGVKVAPCFGVSDLALIDFPAAVELTEGRDAIVGGPRFDAVARAFYRRAVDYADDSRASPRARRHIAELAAKIGMLMFHGAAFEEAAPDLVAGLIHPARVLVRAERLEALLAFLGSDVAERLFVPESFSAERAFSRHLLGERDLLEDELAVDAPEPLATLAARRPDLEGIAALAERAADPRAVRVALVRGRRRGPSALPCLAVRGTILVREDASAVRSPRGWVDVYALRAAFDRASGVREAEAERDLIVLAPLGG